MTTLCAADLTTDYTDLIRALGQDAPEPLEGHYALLLSISETGSQEATVVALACYASALESYADERAQHVRRVSAPGGPVVATERDGALDGHCDAMRRDAWWIRETLKNAAPERREAA